MESLIGRTLGHYRIAALLGEGGVGAVFKAYDETLQRDVAIKVLHPSIARQKGFQEQFLQEARTAARLDYPGIVKVYEFGVSDDHLYIVMELIPGANLSKLLNDLKAQGKWIVLTESVELIRQVCLSVDYAHRHGILHPDLKPESIMLKPEPVDGLPYRPVLTDLGLAKFAKIGLEPRGGTSMVTPAYISPEQALGQPTDSRSDVYSLGILLFELAVGRLPFPAKTITEAVRFHAQEPPPAPRSLRPDLSETLEKTILTALAKAPSDRFSDANAMAEALSRPARSAAEIVAPAASEAPSAGLLTEYERSLVEPRGPSALAAFPPLESKITRDQITVLIPNSTARSVPLEGKTTTIGSDAANDLVLDRNRISRQHARITFNGTDYQVTDLGSTNGTYLGETRLLSGVPEIWNPGTLMRIGDALLRLERRTDAPRSAPLSADASPADHTPDDSSAGEARVAAFIEQPDLEVEAGGLVSLHVTVLNQGNLVDHFLAKVSGIPEAWVEMPAPLRLMPGSQGTITVNLRPPRSPSSLAGRHPLSVAVTSQDDPRQKVTTTANLTIKPYHLLRLQLEPERVRAGRPARVVIENQGNSPSTSRLQWQDRGEELSFQPSQTQVTLPEGQKEGIVFRARPKERRLLGGVQSHPFSVSATQDKGEALSSNGELLAPALIAGWLPPLVIALAAILCVGGFLAWREFIEPGQTEEAPLAPTGAVGERPPPPPAGLPPTLTPVPPTERPVLFGVEPDANLSRHYWTSETGGSNFFEETFYHYRAGVSHVEDLPVAGQSTTLVTFDISTLRGRTILNAWLDLSASDVIGDPFRALGSLTVEEVSYADFGFDVIASESRQEIARLSRPVSELDLTLAVADAIERGSGRIQLRLRFPSVVIENELTQPDNYVQWDAIVLVVEAR